VSHSVRSVPSGCTTLLAVEPPVEALGARVRCSLLVREKRKEKGFRCAAARLENTPGPLCELSVECGNNRRGCY
jgi:hypothetical protein